MLENIEDGGSGVRNKTYRVRYTKKYVTIDYFPVKLLKILLMVGQKILKRDRLQIFCVSARVDRLNQINNCISSVTGDQELYINNQLQIKNDFVKVKRSRK